MAAQRARKTARKPKQLGQAGPHVDYLEDISGLYIHFGEHDDAAPLMPRGHWHNSVEMNYLARGAATYLLGDQHVELPAGRLMLFWGAMPHVIVNQRAPLTAYSMHIPLTHFVGWSLPEDFVHRLLRGRVAVEPQNPFSYVTTALFQEWRQDIRAHLMEWDAIIGLEVKARIQRMIQAMRASPSWEEMRDKPALPAEVHSVQAMARHIALSFQNPLTVVNVAQHAGLHPKYATQLFRKRWGMSLKKYITLNRLHHAQYLLMTTGMDIVSIAFESGFGSVSQFYGVFQKACGMSPKHYRDHNGR